MIAELTKNGKRIEVRFPLNRHMEAGVKAIPGASRLRSRDAWEAVWTVPRGLVAARALRSVFGEGLKIGPALRRWSRSKARKNAVLEALNGASSAILDRLPREFPDFARYLEGRPYQTADVAFMVASGGCINGIDPGLGKTAETIAAVLERRGDTGRQLVLAPVTSLGMVWARHIARWSERPVLTGKSAPARADAVTEALRMAEAGEEFWLVVNPEMAQLKVRKEKNEEGRMEEAEAWRNFPELAEIEWDHLIVDEYHRCGLANRRSLTARGIAGLQAERRYLLSATPMGGRPRRLWSALHTVAPEDHPSEWTWIYTWLETSSNGFGEDVEGVAAGREEEFRRSLLPYVLRRKNEAPEPLWVDVPCDMTERQAKQYRSMVEEAELRIGRRRLSAIGIMAEYVRLQQIANAECAIRGRALQATTRSGKFPLLLERLAERGIARPGSPDEYGAEKAIIASRYKSTLRAIGQLLDKEKIDYTFIIGGQKEEEREEAELAFQSEGGPRVILITTTAGGVSITLERAESVHLIDETWDPDDQEQVIGRARGRGRNHVVTVYRYWTPDTIEEYIREVTAVKEDTNKAILRPRRAIAPK